MIPCYPTTQPSIKEGSINYELYKFDKTTKVLKWHVCTRGRKYFDGDDWSWEMWEEYQEVTDKRLKNRILKANKENIARSGLDRVYMYADGRIAQ